MKDKAETYSRKYGFNINKQKPMVTMQYRLKWGDLYVAPKVICIEIASYSVKLDVFENLDSMHLSIK